VTLVGCVRDQGVNLPRNADARITEVVRAIEQRSAARHTLDDLAARAGLSPFHFLRTFRHKIGVTPHQFIIRTRLRDAATRLATESAKVIDVALAAGFGDLSNFNHAFRAEFGVSPRRYRMRSRSICL
jgi:transcriptional regulator GlxA family with amidase domain